MADLPYMPRWVLGQEALDADTEPRAKADDLCPSCEMAPLQEGPALLGMLDVVDVWCSRCGWREVYERTAPLRRPTVANHEKHNERKS